MVPIYKFKLFHYFAASFSLPELHGDCWLGLYVSAEPWASGLSAWSYSQDRPPSLLLPSWRAAHLEAEPAPALPVGTMAGKRAMAVSLWALSVWAAVVPAWGLSELCLSWHTFWECVKHRTNCGKAEKATTPAEKPEKTGPLFFFILPSSSKLGFKKKKN